MRVLYPLIFCLLVFSCNGEKVGSIGSGSTTADGSSDSPVSSFLSTLAVSDPTVDVGDSVIVEVTLRDKEGNLYLSPEPLQVVFYTNGGTSQGTFTPAFDNGNGTYSALYSGTKSGTPVQLRALVNFADVRSSPYPTIEVVAPDLEWTPPGAEFGFINITTSSSPVVFTLKNNGNKDAFFCSSPVLSNTTDFFIDSETCGTSDVPAGGSCDVTVKARPAALGLKRATLSRVCANTGTVSSFPLQIRSTGVQPTSIVWSPLTYSFPKTSVGSSSASQTFTLTNSGIGETAQCSAPQLQNTNDFRITSDTCQTGNLSASGGTCSVTVVARPLSVGAKSTTLSRTCVHGGTISTNTNGLSYVADLPVSSSVSPLTADFGSLPAGDRGKNIVFTFRNSGSGTVSGCSTPALSNATDFFISTDDCMTSDLGPFSSCKVSVYARPQTAGSLTTTLSRTCTYGGVSSTTTNGITVTGIALAPAMSWFRAMYDLGNVSATKTSSVFRIPLINNGTADATGCSAPALTNTTDFTLVSDGCGTADLGDGEQCLVTVRANPGTATGVSASLNRTCTVGGTATASLGATGKTNTVSSLVTGTGESHSCVVMSDGTVRCWGSNFSGQLGLNDSAITLSQVPVDVPTISTATSLSTYADHTCVVLGDTSVTCWGLNTNGQLGSGNVTPTTALVSVTGLTGVTQMAAGTSHSCALLTGGTVKCWGLNSSGQLGDGTFTNRLTPVAVTGVTNATALAAGGTHTCALITGGTVKCWGSNVTGALGDTTNVNRSTAITVSGITDAESIAAGEGFTCAVRDTGNVLSCWGANGQGQLGINTTVNTNAPGDVTLGGPAASVAAGKEHACALLDDDTVKCWGKGIFNQTGDDSYAQSLTPVPTGITTGSQISVGSSHSCALLNDNSVSCWGENSSGLKFGDGSFDYRYQPNQLTTIPNVTSVSQGDKFSCAVAAGKVFCWGDNSEGQLGDGTNIPRRLPGEVTGITTAVAVEAGGDHACALLSDDSVVCWGSDMNEALGNGAGVSNSLVPVTILTNVDSVKVGHDGGCALMTGGTVRCWGLNNGDVGNNTVLPTGVPSLVTGITTATSIAKGRNHSCARLADTTVTCWGQNTSGAMGVPVASSRTPYPITDFTNVLSVHAENTTTCAIMMDGTLNCWGLNTSGQVGNGTTTNQTKPVPVNLGDVVSVSPGSTLTCATRSAGDVHCFGNLASYSLPVPTRITGLPPAAGVHVNSNPCVFTAGGDLYCLGTNSDNKTNADTHTLRSVSGF